ncbi:toll/interleukin-1 receptor domain-containing protein [Bradyrhizobium prioriisuperbiae]|uniref:toll/interleukin-1 receptor domain-containing protein n=1 Tax=Bradyrhizobium prioriisuperbiae TaxID=2854389 RepID=UPI0028E2F676|nr:toll/interleukin-1 receptor domain-containing protein [Bradyrhizobium prioritasuperba]
MSDIFISYRWTDGASSARLIAQHLTRAFPGKKVFWDQDQRSPGSDLEARLRKSISESHIVLFVIGLHWFTRLSQADAAKDYCRIEVETALATSKEIIPVYVDGAREPEQRDLDDVARSIAGMEFLQIRHESFDSDLDQLRNAIRKKLGLAPSRHRIANINDVIGWGWEDPAKRLAEILVRLDNKLLGFSDPRDEGTVEQWEEIFWNHSEHWRLLVDNDDNIVGYWEMHLLFDEFYREVKVGRIAEDELSMEMMPDFHFGGDYPAYLSMIGIEPGHKNDGIGLLIESFFFVLLAGAFKRLFVSEITARAWTKDGKRLCRQLGMKEVQRAEDAVVDVEHRSGSMRDILTCAVDRGWTSSWLLELYESHWTTASAPGDPVVRIVVTSPVSRP